MKTETATTTTFDNLLRKIGACENACGWAHGKSLRTIWDTCERGDWLLWLIGRMSGREGWPSRRQVVLAACDCGLFADLVRKRIQLSDELFEQYSQ